MITESEKEVIKTEINDGDIVFDVGFYTGEWSAEVFKQHDCILYGFEAIKNMKFPGSFLEKRFTIFDDIVISDKNASVLFYVYIDQPHLSTIYKRNDDEKPNKLMKQSFRLDYLCRKHEIKKIDFLKIDVEGAELDVLKGCQELLEKGKIDKIQFKFGENSFNNHNYLHETIRYLAKYGFKTFNKLDNKADILSDYLCKR